MSDFLPNIFIYSFVFILGTMIGSFLNVVIYRLPQALLSQEELNEIENEDESEIPQVFGARFVWGLKYVAWDIGWILVYLFKELPHEMGLTLKSISFPASQCSTCNQKIAWYDNIPIVSWFILQEKCRKCKTAFSFRYPLN